MQIGTVDPKTNVVTLDKAAVADAFKAAFPELFEAGKPKPAGTATVVPTLETTTIAHQEQGLSGLFPKVSELKEYAIGGYSAVALSKAIAKVFPVISAPFLADMAAWVLISKFGDKVGIKGANKEAARVILGFDAERALLPIVDTYINTFVAKLPSIGPGPIAFPSIGGGGATAPMRQEATQQQGGGSLVVNRLAVTNI